MTKGITYANAKCAELGALSVSDAYTVLVVL